MLIPISDDNPTRTFPFVSVAIVAISVAVFLYELSLGVNSPEMDRFILRWAMTPRTITHAGPELLPALATVITSMFLHGGFLHIGGNMLYLWIFGNNVEDVLGHGRFLLFYLLCGIGGAIGHIVSGPNSAAPSLGASGAIAGVLAAYLVLFPRVEVLTAVPIFFFISFARLPALVVIGFWFLLQLANGVASVTTQPVEMSAGVAWFAHIGGFVTGLLLILVLPRERQPARQR